MNLRSRWAVLRPAAFREVQRPGTEEPGHFLRNQAMKPSSKDNQAFIDSAVLAKALRLTSVERRRFVDLISVDPAGLRSDGTMPLAVVMKLARVAQGWHEEAIAKP